LTTNSPLSLIIPAKSHPEVVVQAIAARDRTKAEAFAKKHGIPEIKASYQDILNDPNIDAVFIPLPNGLHFEWAVRAIRAGKHVLVEKPSVSNATEAEILFNLPELSAPGGPVLLEAFHNRFFPAWVYFKSLINPADVVKVVSSSNIPWWASGDDSINFNYALSGGCMMAMGTYNMMPLRLLFGEDPVECLSCETDAFPEGTPQAKCDKKFKATFRFPSGGIGEADSTLKGGAIMTPSWVTATLRETVVPDQKLSPNEEKVHQRKLTLNGLIHGVLWHRIDIEDIYTIRRKDTGNVVKTWTEKRSEKKYTFKEAGKEFADLPGEPWWMSYRHQLEEFVNKVKGRNTHVWISGEDSIAQMKMIDMAYTKSGLGLRPTSSFR
jgi:predicted dehydrogenase